MTDKPFTNTAKLDPKTLMQFGLGTLLTAMRHLIDMQEQQFAEYTRLYQSLAHGGQEAMEALLRTGEAPAPPDGPPPGKRRRLSPPEVTMQEVSVDAAGKRLYTREEIAEELQISTSAASKLTQKLGIRAVARRGRRGVYSAAAVTRMAKDMKHRKSPVAAYWARMSPAQRKAEMARRTANGLGRQKMEAAA